MLIPARGHRFGSLAIVVGLVAVVVAVFFVLSAQSPEISDAGVKDCPQDAPAIGELMLGKTVPTGSLDVDLLPGGIVRARLAKAGIEAQRDGVTLRACLMLGAQGYAVPVRQVLQVPEQPGQLDLFLDLPLSASTWNFVRTLQIGVGSNNGLILASSSTQGMGFYWAAIYAVGATALFVLWILGIGQASTTPRTGWSALLGRDGQPSLSLLQIGIWTVVVVFGLIFVFCRTGDLLTLTPQVMALLGFAGLGSLAARWAGSGQPDPSTASISAAGKPVNPPRLSMVTMTGGQVDLFKVQMLAFTTLIAAFVVFRLIWSEAFPELSENLLLLMGVSQSIYVGSKLVPQDPQAAKEAARLELETLRGRDKALTDQGKTSEDPARAEIAKSIKVIEDEFPELKSS